MIYFSSKRQRMEVADQARVADAGNMTTEESFKRISRLFEEMTETVNHSTERIEDLIKTEVGKTQAVANPWVKPAVQIGDRLIPIRELDLMMAARDRTINELKRQIVNHEAWFKRSEENRKMESARTEAKEREIDRLNSQSSDFRAWVASTEEQKNRKIGFLEEKIIAYQQEIKRVREELATVKRNHEIQEEERQRAGSYLMQLASRP